MGAPYLQLHQTEVWVTSEPTTCNGHPVGWSPSLVGPELHLLSTLETIKPEGPADEQQVPPGFVGTQQVTFQRLKTQLYCTRAASPVPLPHQWRLLPPKSAEPSGSGHEKGGLKGTLSDRRLENNSLLCTRQEKNASWSPLPTPDRQVSRKVLSGWVRVLL